MLENLGGCNLRKGEYLRFGEMVIHNLTVPCGEMNSIRRTDVPFVIVWNFVTWLRRGIL
jgi:hypothetical protein